MCGSSIPHHSHHASVAQVHRATLASLPAYLQDTTRGGTGDATNRHTVPAATTDAAAATNGRSGGQHHDHHHDKHRKEKEKRDVVVKVQHQGIAPLMASDMIAAARVLRVVAWLNADFNLMLRLLEAWAEEIERELDFRVRLRVCVGGFGWLGGWVVDASVCRHTGLSHCPLTPHPTPPPTKNTTTTTPPPPQQQQVEATNLDRVRENLLLRAGLDVIVPRPIEGLVARRAFAMEFVEVRSVCVCWGGGVYVCVCVVAVGCVLVLGFKDVVPAPSLHLIYLKPIHTHPTPPSTYTPTHSTTLQTPQITIPKHKTRASKSPTQPPSTSTKWIAPPS
jgi:hypothetical protein